MKRKNSSSVSKLIGFLIAIALIIVAVPVFQLVLGFTDPTANPPGGNGKLASSGSNLSVSSARLVDLASPVDSNDAANKAYVDAQAGGGNTLVTLFGASTNNPPLQGYTRPGGSVPTCIRGFTGGASSCAGPIGPVQAAGFGTPDCSTLDNGSSTWSQLYAGYGPMNSIHAWYDNPLSSDRLTGVWPPDEDSVPDEIVGLSDSICSTASYAFVDNVNYSQSAAQVMHTTAYVSACTQDHCNTCRVCIKD